MDEKASLLEDVRELQQRHEKIKAEMLKILDASAILQAEYNQLEQQLYVVEREYVDTLAQMAK